MIWINKAVTESWNGTSWTEVNDLNTARYGLGGTGVQTSSLVFGGNVPSPVSALTEEWNGVSWVEVADLTTARTEMSAAGTTAAGLAVGGDTGSVTASNRRME